MQNVSSDTTNNNEKIDKGSNLQDLGKVSTPQSFNTSPIKSEFNPSYAEIFLSDTSDSEDDDVSEVEAFVIDQDDLADEAEMEEKYYLPSEEDSEDHTVDPETQARLEALLEAAGIGKLATGDGKLADPEVLRRLTSSVSCALDEAAAALTRMRNENPRPQNERSLVQACSDGDVKTVKKLLIEGRSVHETTDEGESLLSLACSAGYYELAQVLLAMHANVEDRGIKGECTPLMEAASSGFIEIVRLLVNHGADVNGQSSSGNTPLMYACAGGHEAVVRVLLECGGNVEDHNENGHTPLMEAASAGHVGVAKILLEYGAGINTHSNEFKESALTLACYKGHLDMVRFLLSAGADQEHKTDEMHTALMEASMDGHVEVAKLLLDSGAQVNMPTDSFESPLTLAACGGHVDLALLLIERGANIEEVNDEGYTPLMEAAREGHEEMVCVLLQKGAKINAHTEETQETALTLACCGGFLDVADFLLKNGADIELGASTPLMEAAQEGHLDLVRYLLDRGAQVHAKTQTGDTALTYACENGHTDVADLLLSYGANLEHESEGGRTPLMKACRAGHLCTVQFLISKNADVNRQTSNNDHTPLSLACAGGHLNVVQLLLAHNADPYHKLKDNSTMLIEAAKGGHTNVVQLLLDFPRSVISGSSISPPSEDPAPAPHVCSQGDHEVRCCGVPLGPVINQPVLDPPTNTTPASVAASAANTTTPPANVVASPGTAAVNIPNAEKVREKLHSLNLQQLKLLQKEKLQLQELQTKHSDILELKKKKQEENATPVSPSEPPSNSKTKQKQKAVPGPAPSPVQTQTFDDQSTVSVSSSSSRHPTTSQAKSQTTSANTQTIADCKQIPTAKIQTITPSVNTQTTPCATSQTKCVNSQATSVNSQATSVNSQTSSFNGQTAFVNSQTTSVNGQTAFVNNQPPSVNSLPTSVNVQTTSVKSQTTSINSQTAPVNCEASSAVNSQPTSVNSPPTSVNTLPTSVNSQGTSAVNSQAPCVNIETPLVSSAESPAGTTFNPSSSVASRLRDVLCLNAAAAVATQTTPGSTTVCPGVPVLSANGANSKVSRKWRQSGMNTVPSLTSCEAQQVKNASLAEETLNDAKMSFLLQDPKYQGPLANFFQSQFFIDHVKRMKGKETQTMPLCPEGVLPPTPSPPPSPPPPGSEPVTPLNYFGAEATQTSPPRTTTAQGLVVGTQPLFHPGANTTVLHNTIYTRSSVPVPSPADVNQSTAIADRPKAKPVSKKEGKNVKKHHLAAYHFAMQQQKEALQLKQLVEMNEQLVSQVVSQQKQLVLNHTASVGGEASDQLPPSSPLVSVTNDILADSMARSKLLASTAKEMMESMSVKVDMDQETRDLIDQLETITMEEVERAASQGQKKLLQDKLQDYAAGLQDGLKMAAGNSGVTDPRFQQVGVNFVGSGQGGVEDAYQYFTVPSPGGPVQVQQYPNGFQLQYQVSRQEIAQYSKVDAKGSPFSSPALSPKNGSPPPPPADVCLGTPTTTQVVATQTSPSSCVEATPPSVEAPPPCVKKAAQSVTSAVSSQHGASLAHPSVKTKKREAARPSNSHPASGVCLDPSQPRFPGGSSTDTPSSGSVTTSTSYSGMDVDSETESNHDTALTLACAGGHEDLVELLLSRGADIEHRDKKGFTPLILAATAGHDKVVDILLNHVADMEAQSERTKDTPLSLACSGGRYEVVELLLTRGANKEHRNVSDYTPLSLAASGGYVNIIKLLLTHGAEINSRTGSKLGISPLMLAAMNGHTAAVKLLLDMGSDINAQIETNRNTALTLACFQGRHEVVSLLLDRKANVEHRAKTGLTPLMEAASGGYVEVGRVLLDKGADVNAPPVPSSRDTALTIAADKGHCRFVELLLSKGAQVEVKNKKGNSPLWLAANGGHLSVVELLCKHRADIDSQDNRKVSCLMAAFRKGHVKAVRWMVNHVAQFPSDQEMTRYIQTVNDKELLDKCQECSMVIRVAKNQQAEKANKNANILLEELDMEKWREESKRAAQARKRERKKQKKLEKKEEKRKAKEEEEEEDEDDEEGGMTVDEQIVEEEENELETTTGRGEGEEGDSGIDANSQASCSSSEVKPSGTAASSKRKDKKKKKSTSTPNVPAKLSSSSSKSQSSSNSSSNHSLQKNASSSAVPSSSKQLTESSSKSFSIKSSTESSTSKKEKKKQQQAVVQQQHNSSNLPQQASSSSQPASKSASNSQSASGKESKSKLKATQAVPTSTVAENKSENSSSTSSSASVATSANGTSAGGGAKDKKPKEKVTTPRKEPQHLIFESTRHPAEREEFEATGGGGGGDCKERKRTSLMSLYSDGELIASSSGVKIPSSKQGVSGPGGKREEGWKEVVRKYLNTTFRHKKVSVPLNAISRVIGRGGSNINAIRSATSAHIEVEKQCKGQGERIITIKGNNDAIKQANALINSLIRDPDVDLTKLLAETVPPTPSPPAVPSKSISKPAPPPATAVPSNAAVSAGPAKASGPPPAPASSAPPPLLGSLTFVKAPPQPSPAPTLPAPQAMSSAPTPLIPGLRASAPRPPVPRIVPAGGEKRPTRHPVPSSSTSSSSSASIKYSVSPSPSPSPQLRPPPTASAPPSISAPVVSAPLAVPAQGVLPSPTSGLTLAEYSLFNDTFSKVAQQSVWGREDVTSEDNNNGNNNNGAGMNFASVAAASNTNTGNGSVASEPESPPVDVANLAKAPGYRGATTSVSSPPVMCRMSSTASPSPLYHTPSSMYIEDPTPLYQQDLLKMVPGPGQSYIPTTVSMSRLNPRAPDFSCVKTQPSQQAPLFNASVAPPTHIPPPVQVAFPTQPNAQTRWPYPMNFTQQQQSQDMMSHLASLALANNQAGDLFSTTLEMTPPTSPPHAHDERKVQPRPIGTERAWKNYNNVIGGTPVEDTVPWLHHDTKTFGGIGDNRHMFRSPAMPQYSRLPLPEDLPTATHLLDNYQETHYNMNGGATLMLLPQQQQQQTFGLASLLPDAFKAADNSWDPSRLCLSDVPLADKPLPPQVWTKWTN